MMDNFNQTVVTLSDFLDVELSEERLNCVVKHQEGNFKRMGSPEVDSLLPVHKQQRGTAIQKTARLKTILSKCVSVSKCVTNAGDVYSLN
jgi:hypothetical protein